MRTTVFLGRPCCNTYTRNTAQAFDQQGRIGSIASGKQPEFVLLDRDVLTGTAEEARHTKVLWTVVGEKTLIVLGQELILHVGY